MIAGVSVLFIGLYVRKSALELQELSVSRLALLLVILGFTSLPMGLAF
jgi:hypothetical protein